MGTRFYYLQDIADVLTNTTSCIICVLITPLPSLPLIELQSFWILSPCQQSHRQICRHYIYHLQYLKPLKLSNHCLTINPQALMATFQSTINNFRNYPLFIWWGITLQPCTSASFPSEMLTATIVILPKPGKEPVSPENFSPILLLIVDLKIYAKLIANRIACNLTSLIKQDQVGFVLGWQAPDATRRILNLIHHVETTGEPSLRLTLDAEKAFNRIHWGYMSQVLNTSGFTGQIHAAISALYTTPPAFVLSEDFFPEVL